MLKKSIQVGRYGPLLLLLCGWMMVTRCAAKGNSNNAGPGSLVMQQGEKGLSNSETLLFSDTATGGFSEMILTLKNTGTTVITLDKFPAITGTDVSEFEVLEITKNKLAAGESTNLTLTFKPINTGTRSALFTVTGRDAKGDPLSFSLTLTGDATEPAPPPMDAKIVLKFDSQTLASGDSIDFGGVVQNETTRNITVTIKNSGTEDLKFTSPFKISGVNAGDFKVESAPTAAIGPGQEATLTLSVTAQGLGARSATLSFTSNDLNNSAITLQLSALGQTSAAPLIQVKTAQILQSGDTLDFGERDKGTSHTITMVIRNRGSSPLTLIWKFEGIGGFGYPSVLPDTVPPGNATVSIPFEFMPAGGAAYSQTLTLTTNDLTQPTFTLKLKGQGKTGPKE